MVMVKVAAGGVLAEPPPHPVIVIPTASVTSKQSIKEDLPWRKARRRRGTANSMNANAGTPRDHSLSWCMAAVLAVWIVSVEVAVPAPGVKEAGLKVAVAPGGKPVAVSVTGVLKAPPAPLTLMVKVAAWPSTTVADPEVGDTP